ncbi:hypothetical protein Bbelb_313770 [Branchiostoma belcheri]|nr:hypothetical protein Bbelb_313770 [Branchiostoma belcheri]
MTCSIADFPEVGNVMTSGVHQKWREDGISHHHGSERVNQVLNNRKKVDSNLSKEESAAIKSLRQDKNIVILPADKGRCVVILNREDYQQKCQELLNDDKTYIKLGKKDPTTKYKKQLISVLQQIKEEKGINQSTARGVANAPLRGRRAKSRSNGRITLGAQGYPEVSRLEPKNRKDRRHPVANLAARPSATSDNPNSKTYTKSQTYPSTQTRETAANAIFVFPHKTSALGIYIPTRRYVDDTHTTLKRAHADEFTEYFNSLDPDIKFTTEEEQNKTLPFLDTLTVVKDDGSADTIITNPQDREAEKEHITQALLNCGFSKWAVSKATAPKRSTTDRNQDRGPCQETYIGETERSLKTRFLEHRRPSSNTSEVSQHIHIESPGHTVTLDKVRILDTEKDYFVRGVKEAIYIRAHQPSLNRDGGRYRLPATIDALLTSSRFRLPESQRLHHKSDEG